MTLARRGWRRRDEAVESGGSAKIGGWNGQGQQQPRRDSTAGALPGAPGVPATVPDRDRAHSESAEVKKFAGILYPECLAPVEFIDYDLVVSSGGAGA